VGGLAHGGIKRRWIAVAVAALVLAVAGGVYALSRIAGGPGIGATATSSVPNASETTPPASASDATTSPPAGPNGQSGVPGSPGQAPKPSGWVPSNNPLPVGFTPPSGAVSFLPVDGLGGASQTYRASVTALGWQDQAAGTICVRLDSATLLGPVNAATGEPMGKPAAGTPDFSPRVKNLNLLAATSQAARADLSQQRAYTVYLVLLPSEGGAVFVIDKVVP
jgi:hypothetical protein